MAPSRVTSIDKTESTNADLAALVDRDWPEGQWLRADRQTAGRGRLGRQWQSLEGNLQASTLIRVCADDPPISGLGLLVGVALIEAIRKLVPEAPLFLKWPNDVMIGSAKVAGILLERSGGAVIVGVGVNVLSAPDLPARETKAIAELPGGESVNAAGLAELLAERFDHWLVRWRNEGFGPVRAAWLAAAHPPGTRLSVTTGVESRREGRFLGVAADGALLLELDDGTTATLHSGEVGIL